MKRSKDIDSCIMNPSPGASYWIKRRRKIIYQIFKDEILDRTLPIVTNKIQKAISKLGEKEQSRNVTRIRTFVHRLRREYFQNTEDASVEENQNGTGSCWYWNEKRRKIIHQNFKNEIIDRTRPITSNKIKNAIAKLGEDDQPRNVIRIRTFVHRLRKEHFRRIEGASGEENQHGAGSCWYWNEKRRKIIREIFKDELLDCSLRICRAKIIDAMTELEEEHNFKNESKIRTFVHRLREEDKEKMKRMASKPDSVVIESLQENVSNSKQVVEQERENDQVKCEPISDEQSFDDDSNGSSNWTLRIADDVFQ